MLTLYHGRTSVCSIKARLALAEKGVDWDGKLLTLRGDQFDPAYMKLNPNAVVPTLVHDGKVIIESTVIMHYVDEVFPSPSLLPSDPVGRSKLRLTTKLMDEYVHVSCMTITFATANRASLAGRRFVPVRSQDQPVRARSWPRWSPTSGRWWPTLGCARSSVPSFQSNRPVPRTNCWPRVRCPGKSFCEWLISLTMRGRAPADRLPPSSCSVPVPRSPRRQCR